MKINVNDITLNYEKSGSGDAIILLHGNGEDLHIFDVLVGKLSGEYAVYAVDSRNHGGSSKTDDYSYETMASDIVAFAEEMKLINPIVLGFSDGAIIALLAQLQNPGFFRKMILAGLNLHPADFREDIYKEMEQSYIQKPDPFLKMMLHEPNINIDRLSSIKEPVLVTAGENDIFTPESFVRIADNLPDSELKIFEGHDHFSYIIDTDMLFSDIKEFTAK